MSYLELLKLLGPETIVAITALIVLAVDLLLMRAEPVPRRFACGAFITLLGCAAAAGWMLGSGPPGGFEGIFVDDTLVRLVKCALLVLTVCATVISLDSKFTKHVGEYLSLMLLATVGMMMLVSSTDLLMIFIALELTSLSLYILAAFNKQDIKSAEAALKYFLFGGMSAAFTLFGLSLVYGLTGSTGLRQIAGHLAQFGMAKDPLLLAALVMTVIGFGFKVAAVPFHFWAPDAYQGAPAPSVALIASGSKVASFFVLARLMIMGFATAAGSSAWHDYSPGWVPTLAILSAASMVLGNVAAIAQNNVKRLLAYSAIAHSGYALLGLLANNGAGLSSLVFYTVTYGLTVAGAFGVVMVVEARTGGAQLEDFAGLSKREPVLSFCMMIFMLSLAGIPPLAGFFGKFYLFTAVAGGAKDLGMLWLVFLAVAMSAVSLYYYLKVLKQIYVAPAPEGVPETTQSSLSSRLLLGALALGVVGLGCVPDLLVGRLLAAISAFNF
jgi:NADH-quinone oxidoreductase subunit N